ncbi:hypothetical protein EPO33_03985 [Patescibacteria group bacterium]|nr:MAG: hypothetical protein EPO33_03985 [Patescibacteria group bacterium]
MKHALLPVSLAALLLVGAGCASGEPAANAPSTEASATSTSEVVATSTPETTNTNVNTPAPKPTNAPKPTTSTGVKKTFYVELDDNGAYPASGTAAKGSTVTVTFKVRPTNVFYNGLVVTSNANNLGKIDAGQSKTITFTAVEDETFVAQWITGTTKARWTLVVR